MDIKGGNILTDSFINEISNVINNEFRSLRSEDKVLLNNHLIEVINVIFIKFGFDLNNPETYYNQFRQNNYRDIKGLINIILPFINDNDNTKKQRIKSFQDLYTSKDSKYGTDINKFSPTYNYTNLQYGRCNRDNNYATEIPYDNSHLTDNVNLFKKTIETVAHRLYVNWLDVRPVILTEIRNNSKIFIDTANALSDNGELKEWDVANSSIDDEVYRYGGLSVGTIYNVIVNELFHSIKNIKWMIYTLNINNNFFNYFPILYSILPLNKPLNNVSWSRLSTNDKNTFIGKWRKLIEDANSNSIINVGTLSVDSVNLKKLLESIKIFFDKYYKDINKAEREGYKPLKYITRNVDDEINPDEDIDDRKSIKISFSDVYKSLNNLNPEHIYNFLRTQIQLFIKTVYSKDIINYDKDGNKYIFVKLEDTKMNNDLFDKILYNFAKSLSHYQKGRDYLPYPRYWDSLNSNDKKVILQRLNMKSTQNPSSWFNINGYLRRLKFPINIFYTRYYKIMKDKLHYNLFDILKRTGTFNTFSPNPKLTDNRQYANLNFENKQKKIWSELKSQVFQKDSETRQKLEKTYYYLTGLPYGQMKKIVYKDGEKEKKADYFDYMVDDTQNQTWHTMYALDWISQLSFFHRYLNNRVIYVTGSTGVGKSTQIPKLLLYAMRALDYNNTGKIVMTQPRIAPTTNNAERISVELGVPIKSYNEKFSKTVKTDNYHVQYAYRGDKHTTNEPILNLKISTDGLLIKQLIKNPLLKVPIYTKGKELPIFGDKNLYDIVIVDEAHEHNRPMDFILSIMKYSTYYNNSIKLVIVSATMDDDEPTYRRFYRDINDNRMYPLSNYNKENKIDRINVDRRLHISPPGQGTRFRVDEYYEKYDINDKRYNSKEKIKISVDKVIDIISKTQNGDLLLFQPGQADIIEAVKQINDKTNSTTIALPYFSAMSDEKKGFVEKIANKKYELTIDKSVPFHEHYDINKVKTVPSGTYNRVIVVATNVAEASITISSLKYVVDTGNQKVANFDYSIRDTSLDLLPISESSRLQRKGRVGRTGPGTYYAIFPKGTMEGNKIAFNISIDNITYDLYDLMADDTTETYFRPDTNPNKLNSLDYILESKYKYGIDKMIKKQYFTKTDFFNYEGNYSHYDYRNDKQPHYYHINGFSSNTLRDNDGTFYIVHPDELDFDRNILGKIVNIEEGVVYNNSSIKIDTFFNILGEQLLLFPEDSDSFTKTEYGKRLYKVQNSLQLQDIRDLISFIFSFQYGANNDMAILLPMYFTSKKYSDWFERFEMDKGKSYFGNKNSDSESLLKIGKKIIKFFEEKVLKRPLNIESLITPQIKDEVRRNKEKYIRMTQNNDNTDIDYDTYKFFIKIDKENKLDYSKDITQDEINEFIKLDYSPSYYRKLLKDNKELQEFCKKYFLNYPIVNRFINKYVNFINTIYIHVNNLYDDEVNPSGLNMDFKWFNDRLKKFRSVSSNRNINITRSLLHGYSNNIVTNLDNTSYHVPIRNPSPKYTLEIPRLGTKGPLDTSLKDPRYQYFLYLDKNKNSIYCLQPISPKMIQDHTVNIANPQKIKDMRDKYKNGEGTMKSINELFDNDDERRVLLKDAHKFTGTINRIQRQLLNNYDNLLWEKLQDLEEDTSRKQKFIKMLKSYSNKNNSIIDYLLS